MDRNRLNNAIAALNEKKVNLPCPRCSSNNFSVVGESEISVIQPPDPPRGLLSLGSIAPKSVTMPIIIVTCDNCGFVSQHALAALDLLNSSNGVLSRGLLGRR